MKNFNYLFFLILLTSSLIYSQSQVGTGAIVLTGSGVYQQNFDSLASSGTSSVLPYGWYFIESGSNANTTYTAGNGSNNAGDTYSFGSTGSSDRAFGGLLTGSLTPTIGAKFYNNTGSTITQLPISYTGEMWRLGNSGRYDTISFQYSLNATSLTTGTWIDVNELDFYTPDTSGTAGQRNGNNSQYRTNKSFTISGLNIPNGSYFWIRWIDYNASGSDDGLAVDDFSIDESSLPVQLFSFSANYLNKQVKLTWQTATEVNNYGFEIERKYNGPADVSNNSWEKIGFVQGNGNSNSPKYYSFIDKNLLSGYYSYRLKQIDYDGSYTYSDVLKVKVDYKPQILDVKNYPNPFNPITKIYYEIPEDGFVTLKIYNALGKEIKTLINENRIAGSYEIEFDASGLPTGIYFNVLQVGDNRIVKKMQLIK
jgi:hypothetical protein